MSEGVSGGEVSSRVVASLRDEEFGEVDIGNPSTDPNLGTGEGDGRGLFDR